MIVTKKKTCAGWDGNSHPAFLWKRIGGKGYCKMCAYKIEQSVPNDSKNEETEKQFKLFLEIWDERKNQDGQNYCEVTGKILPKEALSVYFDHLLEKSKYPQFRFDKRNIIIVDGQIHSQKTNGFPHPKHEELIDKAKKELL